MTGKRNDVSDLIDALHASTLVSSLPTAGDSLKNLRDLAYPDDVISPFVSQWMDQERRIFDVALGSAAPWLHAESSIADSMLKAIQVAECPILDIGQTRVTAALDVLGIDQSILDNPAASVLNLVSDAQTALGQSVLAQFDSYQDTIQAKVNDILGRYATDFGVAASGIIQQVALDGVGLLDCALGFQAVQTDISSWVDVSAALTWVPRIGDVFREQRSQFLESVLSWESWNDQRRRLRAQGWMEQLGSNADPDSVELIEVEGSEHGKKWDDYSISFLGVRANGRKASKGQIREVGGVKLQVWGVRINHYDTDTYVEVRNPPFGNGNPNLMNCDPLRPDDSQRMLAAFELLGFQRKRRGRPSLTEVRSADEFHASYRTAEAIVLGRRPGKAPGQLEISAEMAMCDRQLRRYLKTYGLPSENKS